MAVENKEYIQQFIENAFDEDVKTGDYSSLSAIPAHAKGKAILKVKEEGVLAGVELAKTIFKFVDAESNISIFINDGTWVKPGDIAFEVNCNTQALLKAERLVLNCMQRMSGVATLTKTYVDLIVHTNTKVLDTRKTTPLFRYFEKWAVRIGGGHNHRFGLYDMIMLKDNHIDFAGGISKAIDLADNYRKNNQLNIPIEVETRNLLEVEEVLNCGKIERIMFDNFKLDDMKTAVKMVGGKMETEASGGINLTTIKAVAETGVDFISVGALTHHYTSLDLSLKAVK
ncbi:MAG: putative nicotinate-nucleotide pyrophosphorylase [Bacteroidota bacterium]